MAQALGDALSPNLLLRVAVSRALARGVGCPRLRGRMLVLHMAGETIRRAGLDTGFVRELLIEINGPQPSTNSPIGVASFRQSCRLNSWIIFPVPGE
jgi:hypothetical protein